MFYKLEGMTSASIPKIDIFSDIWYTPVEIGMEAAEAL